jgi:tetratricopeptide (TPR) repeat protein
MRCLAYLGNIFLFGILVPPSAAVEEATSLANDNVSYEHRCEERTMFERQLQTAQNYVQEGQLNLALAIYEELVHQDISLFPKSQARILGQYIWLRLQADATAPLAHFLFLNIQSKPELLHHLPMWEAIWNILQMLSLHGKFEQALQFFQNVKNIADDIPSEEISTYNLFVETYLLFQCHYEHTSHIKAKELLERHHTLKDPLFREHIHSHLLLYLGELEIRIGKKEIGLLHLQILQKHFPQTSNDIRSRIFLSQWYAAHNLSHEARAILKEFSEKNPQHSSTPQLLYALSQHIRHQGFRSYTQAIECLEIIVHSYPDSEFYVPAKLSEGELLRELHHFFGAQLLYEDLLKKSTLSPTLKAWLQLLRIRCLLALHLHEHAEQERALSLLSSIVDIPQLPSELRVEIQFQQTLLLYGEKRFSEARQVVSQVISDFISNTAPSPKGRYWLKRILRIAQLIAKSENDAETERKINELWEQLQSH